MFYDSDAAAEQVAEAMVEELAGDGPHVVGPTTVLEFAEDADSELLALIDEAIAMTEEDDAVLLNPFAGLLAELETQLSEPSMELDPVPDPFAELLAEIVAGSSAGE